MKFCSLMITLTSFNFTSSCAYLTPLQNKSFPSQIVPCFHLFQLLSTVFNDIDQGNIKEWLHKAYDMLNRKFLCEYWVLWDLLLNIYIYKFNYILLHNIIVMPFTLYFVFTSLLASKYIKMFVLDEADEMLSRGFKDQIYEIFQKLNTSTQVRIWNRPCFLYVLLPGWIFPCVIALV